MHISILPSKKAVHAALALALVAALARLLGVPAAVVDPAALIVAAAGLAWLAIDALWTHAAWSRSPLSWERELPPALPVGVERVLGGSLVNAGPHAWSVRLFEQVDATVEVRDLPAEVVVPAGASVRVPYRARALRRGTVRIAPAELRVASRGGGLEIRHRLGGEAVLRVYPNFAAVARYAWLAGDRRLAEIGIKSYPQRGHGTAFKQLADYRPGDPVRNIDWKASMRHGRPIVREYEDERDQRIVFMLDCGRRMRADEGPASGRIGHFDAALDALMLMAWVALKEGDAVGAITFGGGPAAARAVAPRKGLGALDALIATLHDVEPQALQPDYRAAAVELMARLPKRSLVVVLTNFRDEDASEFKAALSLLRTRHLVLVASLRERVLRELAEQPLVQARDAIEVAGAHLFAQARDAAFRRLAARHSLMLDVEPERLAVALVNRYHAVKRAGLL